MANLEEASAWFKPITEHAYKKYKSFDFMSIWPVSLYEGIIVLNQIGFYLTSIKISEFSLMKVDCLVFLELVLKKCPHLDHIRIENIALNSKMIKKMNDFLPKLKSIELINCSLDDSIGDYLTTVQYLVKLNLRENEKINGREH